MSCWVAAKRTLALAPGPFAARSRDDTGRLPKQAAPRVTAREGARKEFKQKNSLCSRQARHMCELARAILSQAYWSRLRLR